MVTQDSGKTTKKMGKVVLFMRMGKNTLVDGLRTRKTLMVSINIKMEIYIKVIGKMIDAKGMEL